MKGAGDVRGFGVGWWVDERSWCVSGVALPYIGACGVGAGGRIGASRGGSFRSGRRRVSATGTTGSAPQALSVRWGRCSRRLRSRSGGTGALARVWKQRRAILRAAVRVASCAPARDDAQGRRRNPVRAQDLGATRRRCGRQADGRDRGKPTFSPRRELSLPRGCAGCCILARRASWRARSGRARPARR